VGKVAGREGATKGGVGSASVRLAGGQVVAALAAVNAVGDVVDPGSGRVVAGARGPDGRFLGAARWLREEATGLREEAGSPELGANTTLAVVATDAVLTKLAATKMAQMAHDGLARAIDPAHTMYDGDTVFALATGACARALDTSIAGAAAAGVLAEAVVTAVTAATGLCGVPAAAELPAPEGAS
jgi:L-aminopeptidase/D-esterase-like protein